MKTTKALILGIARTGAKFTPRNHKLTGKRIYDAINAGDLIPVDAQGIKAEVSQLYQMGVRYFHEHARNPQTREQTADTCVYKRFSNLLNELAPEAILSFGGSRNGNEIANAIAAGGEKARVLQASLSLLQGGAHFVTTQAAVELQIVADMERQGFIKTLNDDGRVHVLEPLEAYKPSHAEGAVELEVHSTANGGNYGATSANIQMETLRWTIETRRKLQLPYEVEWVQEARSSFLTWYMTNVMPEGLRTIGRLNITILFGFSPKLRFPKSYDDFRRLVEKARAIGVPNAKGPQKPLDISVSVGAAVLPKYAKAHFLRLDVGPLAGVKMGPMERLAAYAAQPDSSVDILRVGLEDTPFILSPEGVVQPATNTMLVERVKTILDAHEVCLDLHPINFAKTRK